MSIERRRWLALLCLPLLAATLARLEADGLGKPADDLFTIWRTFSDAARQGASAEGAYVDLANSWRSAASSGPGIPPSLTPASILDVAPVASAGSPEAEPPSVWELSGTKPRKVSQKSEGLLGSLNSQVEVTDAPVSKVWDDPSWKRTWKTNESWQLEVAGPLSLFGQVGANSDEASQSNMKVSGRTGLACKVPVRWLGDLTLRSGPGVSYTDPLHLVRANGRTDWLLEVQARWPLLFGIGLEYQGSANPSLTPLQQDTVNQDVRLAFPLGSGGKFKLGAKHQWTGVLDRGIPWTDSMQLYMGLELSR